MASLLPNGVLTNWKLSKKANATPLLVLKSSDNGVTWTALTLTTHYTFSTTTNEITFVTAPLSTDILLPIYTTHTDMTESSPYIEPLTDSVKVKAITDKASSALVQSVINKVPVGSQVQDATFTLDDTHTTLTLTESSPAVKVEASLVAVNNKGFVQLTGKEIKWNLTVLGDDGILTSVDNVSTTTDDNADTVLVFNKLIPTNKFISDKE